MHVTSMFITAGTQIRPVESVRLLPGLGMEGGRAPKHPGREISLLMGELIKAARAQNGPCARRFHGDIVTAGLDYGDLTEGMILQAGQSVLIITQLGKACQFQDCPLRIRGEACLLSRGAAFARVIREGVLSRGDSIVLSGQMRPGQEETFPLKRGE